MADACHDESSGGEMGKGLVLAHCPNIFMIMRIIAQAASWSLGMLLVSTGCKQQFVLSRFYS